MAAVKMLQIVLDLLFEQNPTRCHIEYPKMAEIDEKALVKAARDCHDLIVELSDESTEEWISIQKEEDGTLLYQKKVASGPPFIRGIGTVNYPMDKVHSLLCSYKRRREWDPEIGEYSPIQGKLFIIHIYYSFTALVGEVTPSGFKDDEYVGVEYARIPSFLGGLIQARDFVSMVSWRKIDDYLVGTGCSVAYAPKPLIKGLTRGNNYGSGWVIRSVDENSVLIDYIVRTEVGGWIPSSLALRGVITNVGGFCRAIAGALDRAE